MIFFVDAKTRSLRPFVRLFELLLPLSLSRLMPENFTLQEVSEQQRRQRQRQQEVLVTWA